MTKNKQIKVSKNKKIYWCQCSRNLQLIKRGSKSCDTGRVCSECGGKIFEEEKDEIRPSWEESEFAQTIDGQILIMTKKAIDDKHFIEALTLSWSTIEQLLLPRLIGWIAKELKLHLPKSIYKLNAQSTNFVYLCISHDQKLYEKLEEVRKQRNEIVHKITKQEDAKSINKLAKECTETSLLLQQEIMKRFSGKVLIPAINLFRDGWNGALNSILGKLKVM